jgi:hypothetical protein
MMNRPAMATAFFLLAITVCLGQGTAAPAAPAPSAAASDASAVHGLLPISLVKSIDSKKLKEGDEVDGKTVAGLHTSSGVMVPAGSKVVGHVVQSKARSKGDSEASLEIVFDKIQVPGGKDLDIKGVIQAVGANPDASSGPDTGAAGGGTMAGHGGTANMAGPVAGAGPPVGSKPGQGGPQGKMLNSNSTGVVGIKNLQLDNNVLTSTNKEVKLDQGSQLMIKAE